MKPIVVKPPGRQLKNWLIEYGNYTSESEAPESFHIWVGLGTIAGALRRRVSLHAKYFDVLSNLYIVLVAPAGTARKTTALKIGQGLLKEVPGVHFTTKASSPAALIKQFSDLPEKEHQSLTAYSYELGTFFSSNSAEMVDLTTDLYDGNPDWDKQTIARSVEKIPRPWFNFMAATTPQWLGDYLSPTAVEGGFVSRTVFIYEDQRRLSNPFPEESDEHRRLKRALINDLIHISTLNGEFSFTVAGREYYRAWYMDQSRFPSISDERTAGYFERKHIHVLKVAMALSASERDDLTIDERDLRMALTLLGSVEPGMKRSFASVGKNLFATDMERMLGQIKSKGPDGMSKAELVAANYHALGKQQMDELIGTLNEMGRIRLVEGNRWKFVRGE
jgi:hypothetical protein